MELQQDFPEVRLEVVNADGNNGHGPRDCLAAAGQTLWLEAFNVDLDECRGGSGLSECVEGRHGDNFGAASYSRRRAALRFYRNFSDAVAERLLMSMNSLIAILK